MFKYVESQIRLPKDHRRHLELPVTCEGRLKRNCKDNSLCGWNQNFSRCQASWTALAVANSSNRLVFFVDVEKHLSTKRRSRSQFRHYLLNKSSCAAFTPSQFQPWGQNCLVSCHEVPLDSKFEPNLWHRTWQNNRWIILWRHAGPLCQFFPAQVGTYPQLYGNRGRPARRPLHRSKQITRAPGHWTAASKLRIMSQSNPKEVNKMVLGHKTTASLRQICPKVCGFLMPQDFFVYKYPMSQWFPETFWIPENCTEPGCHRWIQEDDYDQWKGPFG